MVLEKTLESPLDCKEIQSVHPEGNQSWIFIGRTDVEAVNSNTLATWCEELTHLKRPWCWERLKAGGKGDDRWDGWMTSLTQWTWVWVDSGSWWWTAKPGVLRFMGSQSRTWLSNWTELNWTKSHSPGSKACWDCKSCWASGLCRPLGPFQVSWCAGEMKAELWWRRSSSVKLPWLSKLALMSHVYLEWLWGCWSYRDETRHFSQPLTLSLTVITPQAWSDRCQGFLLTWPQDPTLQ